MPYVYDPHEEEEFERNLKSLRELGEKLKDRLGKTLVCDALEYVNFNETPLAVQILADHLSDNEVSLARSEYDELLRLAKVMDVDLRRVHFLERFLKDE